MTSKKFFITTAIPYVNSSPHAGFALESVQTDTIARYRRLLGDDVFFLTGTDENALKNVQAAEKEGVPVIEFVNKNAESFKDLKLALNLSYDDFIRTTEERHVKGSQKFWLNTKKEDIYKKSYKGLYCVGCEQFYERDELNEKGECSEHPGKKVEEIEEENYFFKLTNYQKWLEDLIETDKIKIIPETRKNEVLAFIKRGLQDFSISRTKERAKGWGITVPGDENQKIYVWYDALTNYITALDYANESELYKKYWTDNPNRIHVIGKGISRFHAIFWPAMLKSAGVPLPTEIFIHGYITSGGQKMSKTLGNVIDPFEQINKYGTDAVRYFLLREIPSYGDGDYTEERFKEVYNADLANGLGNLVARVAKLCEGLDKYDFKKAGFNLDINHMDLRPVTENLKKFRFDEALAEIWKWIKYADQEIEATKPWTLSGYDLYLALDIPVHLVVQAAVALQPFLPQTAEKILKQFTAEKIVSSEPMFPRTK